MDKLLISKIFLICLISLVNPFFEHSGKDKSFYCVVGVSGVYFEPCFGYL